jgi:DNA-directed RNA polymerase subunit E"
MTEFACRICKRILKGNICPVCKSTDVTRSWKSLIIVFDAENSELAKAAGIAAPGKYALKVK